MHARVLVFMCLILIGQGFICRYIFIAMYRFVLPFCEAKFYAVPSCIFDKLECAMGDRRLWNTAVVHITLLHGIISVMFSMKTVLCQSCVQITATRAEGVKLYYLLFNYVHVSFTLYYAFYVDPIATSVI
jgi:hypothetical protein